MTGRNPLRPAGMTPLQFIEILRGARPDNQHYYLSGGCWELFRILRRIWPQAKPYHTWKEINGHVATEIDGHLYDIRGRIRKPSLYAPMTDKTWPSLRGRNHRWHKNYSLLRSIVPIPTDHSHETPAHFQA